MCFRFDCVFLDRSCYVIDVFFSCFFCFFVFSSITEYNANEKRVCVFAGIIWKIQKRVCVFSRIHGKGKKRVCVFLVSVQNTYILPLSPLFSPNQMFFSSMWFPFQQSCGLTFGRRPDPLQCEMSSHCRVAMLELKQGDVLLWGHNACNAGICNFFVSKNNELMLHMNICELINESAALRKFQVTDQNKLIKWCHLHAPCVPSWWKQIHLHMQCLP